MGTQFSPNTSGRISELGSEFSGSEELSTGQKQLISLYNTVIPSNKVTTKVQAKGSLNKELTPKTVKLDLGAIITRLNTALETLNKEGKQQLITLARTQENDQINKLLIIIQHELKKDPNRQKDQSIESGIAQLRKNLSDTSTDKYLTFDPLRSDASLTPSNPSRPKR